MAATRFAVATHILLYLAAGSSDTATMNGSAPTSVRLAWSVNTNPVVVRRIAGQLARAGLIRVRRGPGGAVLAREPDRITLEDIWRAVHDANAAVLLPIHPRPNPACPVGRRVGPVLGQAFGVAELALHRVLAETTLAGLTRQLGP